MNARAIDCLVNVHFGESEQPSWMTTTRDDYFKGAKSMFEPADMSALLDEMDANGVTKAVLMDNLTKPSVTARKFVAARPDRFALAMGGVNLLRPVPALRELSAVAADLPVVYAVVGPSFWGDGQYPPSDVCTTRSTPSAPNWSCRCASTPVFRGRRSPVRCSIRSTWTGSAFASRNCGCA